MGIALFFGVVGTLPAVVMVVSAIVISGVEAA